MSEQDVASKTSSTQETLLFRGDAPVEEAVTLPDTLASPTGDLVRVGELSLAAGQALFDDWPRYTFHGVLGKGGAGLVFRVFDEMLRRVVALKFLQRCDARRLERLLWEAQAQARADHPNICKVYEVGTFQGYPYISMQYIKGESLDKASAKMSLLQKVEVFRALADALHAAHRQGLLHRDIKPSNILVRQDEEGRWQPYLVDFGIAHELSQSTSKGGVSLVGTPLYMSPEQIAGDAAHLDRPTDVYGLGVTFYECLVGQPPFRGEGKELFEKILVEKPPSLVRLGIERDLAAVVHKCIAKHPSQRYPSMADVSADLGRFMEGAPVAARTGMVYRWGKQIYRHRLAVSVVMLVILALGAGLFQGWQRRVERARAAQERQRQQQAALLRTQHVRYWTLSFQERTQKIASLMRLSAMLPLHDTTPERKKALRLLETLQQDTKKIDEILRGYAHHRVGMAYLRLGQRNEAHKHLRLAWSMGEASAGPMLALLGWEARWIKTTNIGKKANGHRQEPPYLRYLRGAKKAGKIDRDPADLAVLEAMQLLGKEQWSRALAILQTNFVEYPWMYELLRLQAHIHWSRVAWHLRHVQTIDKFNIAQPFQQADQHYRRAVELLEHALRIAPSDASLYESLCFAYTVHMRITEGTPHTSKSITDKGIQACKHALVARPDTHLAHLLLSLLYGAQGRRAFGEQKPSTDWLKRAKASSERALALFPKDGALLLESARVRTTLAEEAMWRGEAPRADCKESAALYARAFRVEPLSSAGPYLYGMWLCAFYAVRHHRSPMFYLQQGEQLRKTLQRRSFSKKGTPLIFSQKYSVLFEGLSLYTQGLYAIQQGRSPEPWFSRALGKLSSVQGEWMEGLGQLMSGFLVMGLLEWSKQASPAQTARWMGLIERLVGGLQTHTARAPWAYYVAGRSALLAARRLSDNPQGRLRKLQEAERLLSASIRRKTDFFDAHAALLEVSLTAAQIPLPPQKEQRHTDTKQGLDDLKHHNLVAPEVFGIRAEPTKSAEPNKPPMPKNAIEPKHQQHHRHPKHRRHNRRPKHQPRDVEIKGLQHLQTGSARGSGQRRPSSIALFLRMFGGIRGEKRRELYKSEEPYKGDEERSSKDKNKGFRGGMKDAGESYATAQIRRMAERIAKIRSFPDSPQRTRLLAEVERTLRAINTAQKAAEQPQMAQKAPTSRPVARKASTSRPVGGKAPTSRPVARKAPTSRPVDAKAPTSRPLP